MLVALKLRVFKSVLLLSGVAAFCCLCLSLLVIAFLLRGVACFFCCVLLAVVRV